MKASTLLAAGCLAALLSCATGPSIRSDYDQKADFSRYRTFGYMSPLGTDNAGCKPADRAPEGRHARPDGNARLRL